MARMRDIRVTSWNELNDCLFENSFQEALARHRSRFVFRGMARASYKPMTGLARLGDNSRVLEEHILRAFIRYARQPQLGGASVWNWLALAQHHGLPTRLLDWTYSPFVAAHFATRDLEAYDDDAVIWCVNFELTNEELPAKLRALLQREGAWVFTAELLEEIAATLKQYDALTPDPFLLFFEPPSIDDRIVNQYALFSLLSDARIDVGDWIEQRPGIAHRIIIPSELKWEVRDKLDQANITERVLHPGLDGLSAWLRRYYTPIEKKPEVSVPPAPQSQLEKTR